MAATAPGEGQGGPLAPPGPRSPRAAPREPPFGGRSGWPRRAWLRRGSGRRERSAGAGQPSRAGAAAALPAPRARRRVLRLGGAAEAGAARAVRALPGALPALLPRGAPARTRSRMRPLRGYSAEPLPAGRGRPSRTLSSRPLPGRGLRAIIVFRGPGDAFLPG